MEIKIMDKVLAANDAWAEQNRTFLREKKITMFNLIGSPGAGKTTLLERTIDSLKDAISIAVIEGDIATLKDAERIQKKGVPVYQINTGNACHLDAHLVNAALKEITKEKKIQIVFVENIGNLVCPAEFDIGEQGKIAVLSVTEGDDKIEKYPLLFAEATALIIAKMGLLEHTNFNIDYAHTVFRKINKDASIFKIDSLRGDGFDAWLAYIMQEMKNNK